jgi:outer membrane protein assembly complex protein YaeT
VVAFLCVLEFLRGSKAEAAIDDYIGKSIAAVQIVIEGRETTDPVIARVVETREGEPVTMVAVRETVAHLFSLGRFDDVRVDAELREANRVVLRYELSPIHPVTSIRFTGHLDVPGVDVGQMRQAVVDRYGISPPLARVAEMRQAVSDVLRERGYLHADVKPRADTFHAPDRAALVFEVDPGARTLVGAIDVMAPSEAARSQLLDRLGLSMGRPYEQDALTARIDRFVAERRKAGFYEAKVTVAPTLVDGDRTANLVVSFTPGPHVRVMFRGDPLPADVRNDMVPVEREGSVDEDLLEDSTNRIEDYLRAQGYRDATARHVREESGSELVVTFDVKRGAEYRVARVEISGNASIPLADFEAALRLRDGLPFAESALDADQSMIEDLYHRRGFAEAKARFATEPQPVAAGVGFVPILVRSVITEGPRTVVAAVHVTGNSTVPETALREVLGLRAGRPYLDAQLALDREAIQLEYANRGFPIATVDAAPNFSGDRSTAEPTFTIREGTRVFVEHVLVVGNVKTSTETIEREIRIKPGDPLSDAAKVESRRRLAMLGLFRRIQIVDLAHGDQSKRDILVTVEESPATTTVYGGGVEGRAVVARTSSSAGAASERLEVFPRGSFQITRRNLFGGNRSVSLFSSVSIRLQEQQVFTEEGSLSTDQFAAPEYRVIGTYREPRVFNTSAEAQVTATFEQQARSSFNFARRGASLQIARQVTPQVQMFAGYQLQRTRVFDFGVNPADQRLIDRLFPQVRLSSVSSSAIRDTRDDLVDPGAGEYLSANFQLAGRSIGSEVGFAKTFLRAQIFKTIPQRKRLVFAGNVSLGMASAFPRDVVVADAQGNPTVQAIEDLPASERFFAGGDTTVRGFVQDALGTRETLDKDGFPIGGSGTVIFNAELRATLFASLQAVGFVDSGNVFAHTTDISLGDVRGSVGFGVRYRSPVGPIRIDLGFKTHRDEIAGRRESLTALHISLGQAF